MCVCVCVCVCDAFPADVTFVNNTAKGPRRGGEKKQEGNKIIKASIDIVWRKVEYNHCGEASSIIDPSLLPCLHNNSARRIPFALQVQAQGICCRETPHES